MHPGSDFPSGDDDIRCQSGPRRRTKLREIGGAAKIEGQGGGVSLARPGMYGTARVGTCFWPKKRRERVRTCAITTAQLGMGNRRIKIMQNCFFHKNRFFKAIMLFLTARVKTECVEIYVPPYRRQLTPVCREEARKPAAALPLIRKSSGDRIHLSSPPPPLRSRGTLADKSPSSNPSLHKWRLYSVPGVKEEGFFMCLYRYVSPPTLLLAFENRAVTPPDRAKFLKIYSPPYTLCQKSKDTYQCAK